MTAFIHLDEDFREALELDPVPFLMQVVWDAKRPRLVLKQTVASGTLFDDFDQITALLKDMEPCAVLVRAGDEHSHAWVVISWVPAGAPAGSASSWASLDDTIAHMGPEYTAQELLAAKLEDVTL